MRRLNRLLNESRAVLAEDDADEMRKAAQEVMKQWEVFERALKKVEDLLKKEKHWVKLVTVPLPHGGIGQEPASRWEAAKGWLGKAAQGIRENEARMKEALEVLLGLSSKKYRSDPKHWKD